ncbi:3-deoxy-D-manno-octulosonate 8-phosphate phosphatase, YrbI family [Thermosinus carboxydivorans Nor1]|uniref:3-deoxy-D-manno-octulosonate 8-phosphate phosphatase, YrbI family n=1 Tax=Thermosinus carboxydivorans Nor1 TaxID=401526 RepID=A1HRJ1_9FIRM|nr:HAD hydrolase family protein [Thermosinus carboxydivorans]EAX47322.1 3-deoxy-D-manno-octulosonate 8-phosphate phosphatase, YrbI family [Thermosinus carboxydivorans Nor1]
MDREKRAQKVKLLIFDVDGVLTNGQIIFGPDGEAMKVFHSQDGLGIAVAHKVGLKTAIITGRETEMVRRRGAELNITDVYQGAMDKVAALNELLAKHGLAADEAGYVGDDLNDLPVMLRVGFACAVSNAVAEVKAAAHFVATREGGRGAAREIIEFILKAQGKWEQIVEIYRQPGHIETKQ